MTPTGWLRRGDLALAVHDAGGPGRAVVFQHGLGGDASQAAEAFPRSARFRRITLDCPGHGASPGDAAPSIAGFAGHVAALLGDLPRPAAVGGISMGAAIALRLAVVRPDLVVALILVRPAWGSVPEPANMAAVAEVAALLARHPPDRARALFLSGATAARLAEASPDNLASLGGMFDGHVSASLLGAIAADGPGVTEAGIAALKVPALVCGVAEDEIHPEALARDLAGLIPDARYVQLPPKGRDKPAHLAAIRAAVSAFLEEI